MYKVADDWTVIQTDWRQTKSDQKTSLENSGQVSYKMLGYCDLDKRIWGHTDVYLVISQILAF